MKTNEQLWNEIIVREVIKAIKRRDFEFAYFLVGQMFDA